MKEEAEMTNSQIHLGSSEGVGRPPGPYIVEKCIRVGYRGGKRHDGWSITLNGKLVDWSKWKEQALELAARLNAAAHEREAVEARPFGWYCELVHVKSGEVVSSNFFRDGPLTGSQTGMPDCQFEWRATALYERAALSKATGEGQS